MDGNGCAPCRVFLHLHKSGGTTMMNVLLNERAPRRCGGGGLYYCNWRSFDMSACLLPHGTAARANGSGPLGAPA